MASPAAAGAVPERLALSDAGDELVDQIGLIELLDPPAQRTSSFVVAPRDIAVRDFAHAGDAFGDQLALRDWPCGKALGHGADRESLALRREFGGERRQGDAFLRTTRLPPSAVSGRARCR